jgi:hypothetical protein
MHGLWIRQGGGGGLGFGLQWMSKKQGPIRFLFLKRRQTSGFQKRFWQFERQREREREREILRHVTYLIDFITVTLSYSFCKTANFISVTCFVEHAVYKVSLNQRMQWSYAYWNQNKKSRGAEGSIPTSYSKDHEHETHLGGRQYWLVTYTVPCRLYRMLPLLDNTAWFHKTTLASV